MQQLKRTTFFVVLGLISFVGFAQISTDRPSVSFGSSIVSPGSFQLETGFQIDGVGDRTNTTYNASLLRYGINESFELRVSSSLVDVSGIEYTPINVGFKSKLMDENGILPELTFIGHIAMPGGSEIFRTRSVIPSFRIVGNHTLSGGWSLGYNWGMDWSEFTSDATNAFTVILGTSFSDKVSWFFEVYGFIYERPEDDLGVDSGVTYLLSDRVQLDFFAGAGISNNLPDWFTGAGFSFAVGGRE